MIRPFLISILLCLTNVCQAQDFAPSRSVEEMEDGVIVTYTFKGGMHQQDRLYPDAKSWIIPGFGQNMKAGEPSVPVRWDTFSVPSDRVASIELIDCAYTDTAFVLAPAYPPLLMSDTIGYTTDVVLPIQPYQGLFPSSVVQQSRYQSYRGNRMVKVGIYPIQYDAVNQRVRQYSMIQYKVNFTEIPQSELRKTTNKNPVRISASDHFLKNISLNTPQISSSSQSVMKSSNTQPIYQSTEDTRTFLIITTPSIVSGILDFEEWKRKMGMNVVIRTSSSWTVDKVKDMVQNVYDNDDNLYYLLIVGDNEQVPSISNYYFYNGTPYYYITDAPYSYLDESGDCISDIFYGRIPVKSFGEAKSVFAKIIDFEQFPPVDSNFYNNVTECSSYLSSNTEGAYETSNCTFFSEQIRSYLMTGIDSQKSVKRIYNTCTPDTVSSDLIEPVHWRNGEEIPIELQKPNYTWTGNADSIVNTINTGTFLITAIMHGDTDSWLRPSFEISDTARLTNSSLLPVVFSMSCESGKFDDEDTGCLAAALLKKKNGGAIACIAPTGKVEHFFTESQMKGYINAVWPQPGIRAFVNNTLPDDSTNVVFEIGEIMQQGHAWISNEYYTILNNLQTDTIYFVQQNDVYQFHGETFHCFGDPSMKIFTEVPYSFIKPFICYNNGKIIVQTHQDDTRINFFDIDAADWITKSYVGNYAEFEPEDEGDLVYVSITKPNYRPYLVKCQLHSAIQNENIASEQHYAAKTMKIGTSVVGYLDEGDVLIDGGIVTIHAKSVEIHPNTTIINSEFEINPE